MKRFSRAVIMVLDSAGIGAMPDAAHWGDAGADTIGHIVASEKPNLPSSRKSVRHIRAMEFLPPTPQPEGAIRKSGHFLQWERHNGRSLGNSRIDHFAAISHVSNGFPDRIVIPFQKAIGRTVLGNKTGRARKSSRSSARSTSYRATILYTSADSVFQIAAHEAVIPLEELYRFCRIAREMLDGEDRVGRVIARPFVGEPGSFTRTGNRKDLQSRLRT